MKIIKNYIYNLNYQILAIIVPLITAPYISRVLGPKAVGINAFTNSIIQYFILFANMGIGYYGNRQIAYVRDNKSKMVKTFWEIQIVKVIMTLFSLILFEVFMIFFYSRQPKYMLAQSINLIAVIFDISWFYDGIENFKITVLKNSLVKIISMIMIFTFIKKSSDLILYIIVLGLSTLMGNLTLWPNIYHDLPKINWRLLNPWPHVIPMFELFIPQIAMQVYGQLNITMLGVMVNEKSSGFYQYSDNIIRMLLTIVTAIGTVMLPHVANEISRKKFDKVKILLYKSFSFTSLMAIPMFLGCLVLSRTIAMKYYGNSYGPVGNLMMIEAILIVIIAWSNVIGVQFLIPTNRVKQFTNSILVGTILNIVLNLPLIHLIGLNGAMISTVISETSVTLYQLWVVHKIFDFKFLFKDIPKYLIAAILMFIPVYLLNKYILQTWINIILEVIIGIIIYFIVLLLLKVSFLKEIRNYLKRRFNK